VHYYIGRDARDNHGEIETLVAIIQRLEANIENSQKRLEAKIEDNQDRLEARIEAI
jgi:molecular chaperone GrpE (heat shock protein)